MSGPERVEVWERGDRREAVGIYSDQVFVTYAEWKRLVEQDGWAFSHHLVNTVKTEESND